MERPTEGAPRPASQSVNPHAFDACLRVVRALRDDAHRRGQHQLVLRAEAQTEQAKATYTAAARHAFDEAVAWDELLTRGHVPEIGAGAVGTLLGEDAAQ